MAPSRWQRLIPFHSNSKANVSPTHSATSKSAAPNSKNHPQGLQVIAEGINPVVDIVAVHGLNGHREKTWTTSNGVYWLRDLLPEDLPNVRILSWGYDANTHSNSRVSCQYLYDLAKSLVSDLCLERQLSKARTRPIIFVAHSLGGIVVKSALIHSDAARQGALEEHRSIKLSTYGIFFMGTPHQGGGGVHLGRLMVNIASVFVAADNRLLKHLERDSEWLQMQLGQYGPVSGDFVTKFAFEEYPTPTILGQSIMVVPRASAVVPGAADAEPIAIHADHINMVKFDTNDDNGYKTVSGHLRIMVGNACDVIGSRWDTEARLNAARMNDFKETFLVQFSISEVSEIEHFVGREEELAQMREQLPCDDSRKIVVLHGLGGIGKTQLAVAYAKRHRNDYSAVFWLNSKDEGTLKQSFAKMVKRIFRDHPSSTYLKTVVGSGDLDEAVNATKRWLSNPGNNRWLLVYDNYDEPKLTGNKDPRAFDIRPFLPEAYQGAIVITTRSSQVKIGYLIPMRKLQDIQHSLEILSHTSGRRDLSNDPDARELARQLDGLPLALATAGAYLDQVATSFAEYLCLYKESWLKLQQTTPQLLPYEDRTLYSTWALSLDHVRHQNALSAKLLQLWAYFDNQDLWFELLRESRGKGPEWFSKLTEDELSFNEAIRVLCDHALVEADASMRESRAESSGYSMHGCVHSWTVHVLNREWDFGMAKLALNCVGSLVPYTQTPRYWVLQRRLMRHANRCLHLITTGWIDWDENVATLGMVNKLGNLYRDQGKLGEAEKMYQRALEGKEKALGPEHISTLDTIHCFGMLYMNQGKLSEAEKMYQRAIEGKEKALGTEHQSTLRTFGNLGSVYAQQGKLGEAEKIYQRALKGKEKAFGAEHPATLNTIICLGNLYRRQSKLGEAEKMYQRALEGTEKALGAEHTATLNAVHGFGLLYLDQGKLGEAEKMYQRALEGKEKVLGAEHKSTLAMVGDLGNVYAKQGKLDEAEKMYLRALKGKEKAFNAEHPATLNTIACLGNLYRYQGKLGEAEKMYQRALEGREKAVSAEHTATLNTVNNLAHLDAGQGRFVEEGKMYQRALKGREKTLGERGEEEKMCPLAWVRPQAVLGPNHQRCQNVVQALAALMRDPGQRPAPEAHINQDGRTPLSWAAENGREAVVKLLIAKDCVDLNFEDSIQHRTPLSWAAWNGREAVVKLLLAMDGVDPDSKSNFNRTPLSLATERGHARVMKLLLTNSRVNPNFKDDKGRTPLSWAAENGYEGALKLLLAKDGLDLDSKDIEYGRTPLLWAARNGHKAVVKLLLAINGVDPNSKDKYGQTPLLWAASNGHETVVKLLLATNGVDPNSKDQYGQTPLWLAAESGHEAVVTLLLATNGVDPNSKDNNGRTPLKAAARNGHRIVAEMLFYNGAVDNEVDVHKRSVEQLSETLYRIRLLYGWHYIKKR